jgi:pyruvate/2-oxoglutarate dehydrogenase complex dihydrolipoamide dehydrogenase (E3) component
MCDATFAAIGREPAIGGLELESAGVRFGKRGIQIDRHCRTSRSHIYAAGDVTGKYQFTHMAEHMSRVAVTNAMLRWPKALDEKHVVWTTFTEPELAHLGESEAQLANKGKKPMILRFPFTKLDRAITDGAPEGEVKVFADQGGRILSVSIYGPNAGEMISEWAVAMRNGLKLAQIADTIHPYPTYMLANRRTADQFGEKKLDSRVLKMLARVLRYRGQLKGSKVLNE